MRRYAVALALGLWLAGASAVDRPLAFDDPALAARYAVLSAELRCLVCQNQSLADSHADLAQDMRDEIQRLLVAGASDDDVVAHLVARYGDFVHYRPPFEARTWLLWGAPLLLSLLAAVVVVQRARRAPPAVVPLSDDERARLARMAAEHDAR
jgi:cytochrome c-type biogenesis protein CcmH